MKCGNTRPPLRQRPRNGAWLVSDARARLTPNFVERLFSANVNAVTRIALRTRPGHQLPGPDADAAVARRGRAAMRMSGVLCAATFFVCFNSPYTHGQSGDQPPAEEQFESFHKHHDTHQGHDHYYPDRGSIVREAPKDAVVVSYAGLSYRFHDGVWFEPRGPAFMVVAPPIGLIVPALPTFATVLARGGELYLYCNDVYYRPRPDVGGYEVVNDPAEGGAPKAKSDAVVGPVPVPSAAGSAAAASAPRVAAQAVPAASMMISPPPLPASAVTPASSISAAVVPSATPAATGAVVVAAATPSTSAPGAPTSAPAPSATPPSTSAPNGTISLASAAPPGPAPGATTTAASIPAATPPPPPAPIAVPAVAAVPSNAVPGATTGVSTTTTAAAVPATLPTNSSSTSSSDPPKGIRAAVYPKNGQGADQLARDRYECYRFAVAQSGFDPIHPAGAANAQLQYDYDRAQSACFDARGYTIK